MNLDRRKTMETRDKIKGKRGNRKMFNLNTPHSKQWYLITQHITSNKVGK